MSSKIKAEYQNKGFNFKPEYRELLRDYEEWARIRYY